MGKICNANFKILIVILFSAFLTLSCSKKKSSPPAASVSDTTSGTTTLVTKNYLISWTASNESSVNTTGGGYKIYYSQTSGFGIADSGVSLSTVNYSSSSSTTDRSATLALTQGTWYVKVVGFNSIGGVSSPSDQITIVVQ